MMVGAVLVQNTAWTNVEWAIARLRERGLLEPQCLARVRRDRLEALIRPAGAFRVKATRLSALVEWYVRRGGVERLSELPTGALRKELLEVYGVGAETADAILCYAFGRAVFPVDAYARRVYRRLGVIRGGESYETLRSMTERAIGADAARLGEWHALLVEHGKRACRLRPDCGACALAARCLRVGIPAQAR